jgi:hypothetical protein
VIDHKSKTITVTEKDGRSIVYSTGMAVPLTVIGGAELAFDLIFE